MFYTREGYITYRGLRAMQNQLAFPLLRELLARERFANIIEIGTAYGGTALFLMEQADRLGAQFVTFDVQRLWHHPELAARNVAVMRSCFAPESIEDVSTRVRHGRTLLLCDGADKPREVATFAPLMAAGDIIMTHDYASDEDAFETRIRGRYWDWLEVTDQRLSPALPWLSPYPDVALWKAAWGCWSVTIP